MPACDPILKHGWRHRREVEVVQVGKVEGSIKSDKVWSEHVAIIAGTAQLNSAILPCLQAELASKTLDNLTRHTKSHNPYQTGRYCISPQIDDS